jgi:hypothetical protein
MKRFDGKAWFILFCHPLKLYVLMYKYCIFSLLIRLLRISLNVRIPFFYTYERERGGGGGRERDRESTL